MNLKITNIYIYTSLILICSCCSKIHTITAFEKSNGKLVKKIETFFDKNGNELKEIRYGESIDRIKTTTYEKGYKITEIICDKKKDTNLCTQNFISKFSYDKKNNIEKETVYVKDSLIWLIRIRKVENKFDVLKTFSWENEATTSPNYKDAFIITDTIYYDIKKRLTKVVSCSKIHDKPFIYLYSYTNKNYSNQIIGTKIDTTYNYKLTKEQIIIQKKIPKYQFYYPKELIYVIDYY